VFRAWSRVGPAGGLLLSLALLAGCEQGQSGAAPPAPPAATPAAAPPSVTTAGSPLEALRQNASEVAARSEVSAERIRVAHILVAFQGAMRATVTRSMAEAEARAAELLARATAGEDFVELMKQNSDDSGPGIYGMTTGAPGPDFYPRQGMAPAFGDVGWRLDVGQIGVAPFDPEKSPFGWHIIKRLE